MQLETKEEKEIWVKAVVAVLGTEDWGEEVAFKAADNTITAFRKRTHIEKLDTQI